ncbi:bifunctional phosphopantothenoylcysteine decarboxylase/phosphopantothenate--cysteine ligase CoaBC [Gracilibacillus oryzae]|uniref:Coenzyme A biosynthesis bifunctional protein CoaBC n=1 Tax=Gracilibacillus oryzae TaxID=1672701 RepID=A0A7C8KU84_9BACI|nr:bifunctional phosphopantothenoylcysteine decarboxylase/phosphopantothenate--cysteine ligase CoaBC [Gracilibacillus oryzae]KAB8138688.1 bifunctional phosphopantothenoylcysteine decarboxylase/phosphopantothenate--cysteine ligase CoaBC [Gracilibacillus oryzae]
MLEGKKILLGVSGGIAAYKAIALTSKLTQAGADVRVIMTQSATEFVTPLSFQAISRNEVYTDTFEEKDPRKIAHIDLADWPDFILLAPATAHLIGRIANGLADDLLTTTLLAATKPVYVAPAMNVHMYKHPAVRNNMQRLDSWGYRFIEPGDGYLACGYIGKGRLEEPETIVSILQQEYTKTQRWNGKKVLISAGPTRETVDAVRFFTNYSSGKMGYELAKAAAREGAEVHLVTGPTQLSAPAHVKLYQITTAEEMFNQMTLLYEDMDIVIKSAAVADYKPVKQTNKKMKKKDGNLFIELERTKDILKYLGDRKQKQYLVGFAAETEDILTYGKGKLEKKNLDAIVMNDISNKEIGFQSDFNEVIFLTRDGTEKKITKSKKEEIAKQLITFIENEIRKD